MNYVFIGCGLLLLIIIWLIVDFRTGRKRHVSKVNRTETAILHGNFALFTDGKDFFNDYFAVLQRAEQHIHVLYYIAKNDQLGQQFFYILKERAQAGIEVRLLLDRLGSLSIPKKEVQRLRKAGIQLTYSNRIRPPYLFYSSQIRNHRKISIIDGKIGYLGGYNLGKEYIGQDPKLSPWRDYQLKITGESVTFLQSEFLIDWQEYEGEGLLDQASYFPKLPKGDSRHRLVPTEAGKLEGHFLRLIQKAQASIMIGTPYFIPSSPLFAELMGALRRGVQLTIIVPCLADHPLVQEASYRYFRQLLQAGAVVYQYKKGFYHAKTLLIDETICDIGTANFDQRSLFLNKEINCFIYDPLFIDHVKAVLQRDILDSKRLDLAELMRPNLVRDVKEGLAGMLSYFL